MMSEPTPSATRVLIVRLISTIAIAAFVTLIAYGFAAGSWVTGTYPVIHDNALLIGCLFGVGVGVYAVWLNPRNRRP